MTWVCENCGKEFRNTRQWHSCIVKGVEEHLKNKSPEVIEIFEKIICFVKKLGDFELTPNQSSMHFRNGATFLGVSLKRNIVEIDFFLDKEAKHPLISKKFRVSGKRIIFYLKLSDSRQFDDSIKKLIERSYILVSNA